MKIEPKAFVAIEKTMAASMKAVWEKRAHKLIASLKTVVEDGNWQIAHEIADKFTMAGVASEVRAKLEELAISALLFGAHHVTGDVKEAAYAKGTPIPATLHNALDLMTHQVEHDGADMVRNQLHRLIRKMQMEDKTSHLAKDDVSDEQLAETGGLMSPEQASIVAKRRKAKKAAGQKTLYIRRDLQEPEEFLGWAKAQGFKTTLPPEDLHVTVCYSKEPVDWDAMGDDLDEVSVDGGERGVHQFNKGAVVLQFESEELHDRHFELREKGVSSDFPDYKAHITITYEPGDLDLSTIEPFSGQLIFGPEVFQETKEDWKDDLEEEVLKADTSLADQLNDAVLNGGNVAIDVGANLTTSRLVSFGFLAQAADSNIQSYQVNEVLDGRTCPICRYMHGKTFEVAPEYSRQLQALGSSDPADLKSIAPWPDQSKDGLKEFMGLDLDEMQTQGYGSPPYHPGCRGMLALAGQVEEEIPVGGVEELAAAMGWAEDRIAALQDEVDGLAEGEAKDAAQEALDSGDYDTALADAEAPAGTDTGDSETADDKWTEPRIDDLKWARFDVTDPAAFKEVDDAFEAEDYDKAQELIDKWKEGKVEKDQGDDGEGWDGPNSPKKKRKPHAHSGTQQDYNDIKPDSSNVAFDPGATGVMDDVTAPIDRG